MPLTEYETSALSHFLSSMDSSAICRLAASVTNGIMKPNSPDEARNCIILHAESLFQILNFKRVSREVLLKYLSYLKEPVSGQATKDELLQVLYKKWNLPYPSNNVHYAPPPTMSYPTTQTPSQSACVPASAQPNHQYSMYYPFQSALVPASAQPNHQFHMMVEASRTANVGMNCDPLSQMIRSKEVLKEVNSMAFNEYIVNFARTFYDLLNKPGAGQCRWLHSFNETHFFGESKVKVIIKGADEDIEHDGQGINEVLTILSDLKREHQLYFSPNLTEQGVRSKQDNHGLVSAVVCGTLHQPSGPVGVYEQCFILSADPFSKDSYKILEIVLIMRSSKGTSSVTELMLTSGKKNDQTLAVEAGPTRTLAILGMP